VRCQCVKRAADGAVADGVEADVQLRPRGAFDQVDAEVLESVLVAHSTGIKVLLAPVPPAARFPWRPEIETRPRIAQINEWLERFARETGALWIDYRPVLDDGTGAMKPGLAEDGVHPNERGYDAMATVIQPILRRMFRRTKA